MVVEVEEDRREKVDNVDVAGTTPRPDDDDNEDEAGRLMKDATPPIIAMNAIDEMTDNFIVFVVVIDRLCRCSITEVVWLVSSVEIGLHGMGWMCWMHLRKYFFVCWRLLVMTLEGKIRINSYMHLLWRALDEVAG